MSYNLGRNELFWRIGHEKSEDLLNALKNEKNVNFQDEQGTSYLHMACQEHNLEAVTVLLENGADPNINDKRGYSPIVSAIGRKSDNTAAILQVMLQHGLDLDKAEGGYILRELIKSFEEDELNVVIEKFGSSK